MSLRLAYRAALGVLVAANILTVLVPPRPLLVWNATPSAPVGFYAVRGRSNLRRGDMVIAWLPRAWRTLARARGYIPSNVPLVKRVAATDGDIVCARGRKILINGRLAALRLSRDARGRALKGWSGCRTLSGGKVFLLMVAKPMSFDGRYFGPTSMSDIIGRARRL